MKAVIFDFGGVFIDSPFAAVAALAPDCGLQPEELAQALFGEYERDTDHPWHRLERGELTLELAREEIMAGYLLADGRPLDPFELLGKVTFAGVRTEMVQFCISVRERGLTTGLLTNNAREFEGFWKPLLPLDELFDDVVDSSEVGMRKPAPQIYELALERLGVRASQAVFVDDAPGNVAGAEAVGLTSVLIGQNRSDVPAAIAAIEEHLERA